MGNYEELDFCCLIVCEGFHPWTFIVSSFSIGVIFGIIRVYTVLFSDPFNNIKGTVDSSCAYILSVDIKEIMDCHIKTFSNSQYFDIGYKPLTWFYALDRIFVNVQTNDLQSVWKLSLWDFKRFAEFFILMPVMLLRPSAVLALNIFCTSC